MLQTTTKFISVLSIFLGTLPWAYGFAGVSQFLRIQIPRHHAIMTNDMSDIPTTTSLFAVKRNKMSMAEKKKRRQAKQQSSPNLFENLPPAQLDFKSADTQQPKESPVRIEDPEQAASQAKAMLKAQRDSVDMLTKVRERVESLPTEEISKTLESGNGYLVIDDFLNDKGILDQLYEESTLMYEQGKMETDASNLGSGEYIVSIKGGEEQYTSCPRLVEWVVSTTKHIPEVVKSITLDGSACMATLRTFDRNALKASLALLTGEADDKVLEQAPRKFNKVVTEPLEDKRRLSIQYFVLPESWDESFGGGLEFESGGTVAAKRDRLVLWKSDETVYRKQPWKGNDENHLGGCMELHLVESS